MFFKDLWGRIFWEPSSNLGLFLSIRAECMYSLAVSICHDWQYIQKFGSRIHMLILRVVLILQPIGSMVLVYMLTFGVYWWDPLKIYSIHGSYGKYYSPKADHGNSQHSRCGKSVQLHGLSRDLYESFRMGFGEDWWYKQDPQLKLRLVALKLPWERKTTVLYICCHHKCISWTNKLCAAVWPPRCRMGWQTP